jgi:excisionase family DNA binding protein
MRERLLSVKETAELLGLSKWTIYEWVSKKAIPHVKMGRRVMFDPMDLEKKIEASKVIA